MKLPRDIGGRDLAAWWGSDLELPHSRETPRHGNATARQAEEGNRDSDSTSSAILGTRTTTLRRAA